MAVEVILVGLYRLDGYIVGCFFRFYETDITRSFRYDDHFDVVDSIGLGVVASDGVALCSVAVANTATILLSWRVDTPVASHSLISTINILEMITKYQLEKFDPPDTLR